MRQREQRITWLAGLYVVAASIVLIGLASAGRAVAATAPTGSGNGLRVSPVRTDTTINPGQSQTVSVNVTNVTGGVANLQAIINDFTANPNESGDPAILLNPSQYASSHSLKRFIANLPNVTLQPGEEKAVPVTIKIPANAAGGGYYGALRFAPAGTTGSSQVNLAGSVGSLILVTVPGQIKEQVTIASFDVRRNDNPSNFFNSNKNLEVDVRLQNEGNIQEEPFGKILLENRAGKTLHTYELNDISPPGNVLPDSIRKFIIPIQPGKFGEYKLEGNFGYNSTGQLISASTSFYIIPTIYIIIFIIIVALIAFMILVVPRLLRAYNRSVVRRASRK